MGTLVVTLDNSGKIYSKISDKPLEEVQKLVKDYIYINPLNNVVFVWGNKTFGYVYSQSLTDVQFAIKDLSKYVSSKQVNEISKIILDYIDQYFNNANDFKNLMIAYNILVAMFNEDDRLSEIIISDYPFNQSFDELEIENWVKTYYSSYKWQSSDIYDSEGEVDLWLFKQYLEQFINSLKNISHTECLKNYPFDDTLNTVISKLNIWKKSIDIQLNELYSIDFDKELIGQLITIKNKEKGIDKTLEIEHIYNVDANVFDIYFIGNNYKTKFTITKQELETMYKTKILEVKEILKNTKKLQNISINLLQQISNLMINFVGSEKSLIINDAIPTLYNDLLFLFKKANYSYSYIKAYLLTKGYELAFGYDDFLIKCTSRKLDGNIKFYESLVDNETSLKIDVNFKN